ncbi:MAG TPA: YqgE/AlgH family protein [Comamonadaceae bacterium]|uniref:YqgE/AlgH family protein n=1 Tax=Pulveribacter sp. TaxID=2678893 RepID=UPI000EB88654|nr:YqgE/AlgH family protein [Pulveribacter sp.]HCL87730.1 YqgE/AlgH family protein [Comamonadaceae bacterium]
MSASSMPTMNLTHHFLIAMPGLEESESFFSRSVVYLCEHSERGALGLVINKPMGIKLEGLLEKVDLTLGRKDLAASPVFHGGPLQTERGFVLHDVMQTEQAVQDDGDQSPYASTLSIAGGYLQMTTSKDVLEALSQGVGPRRVLVTLGYASWGEGQLESELAENSWLTVEADPQVIFDAPVPERYDRALALLGLQSWMLSPEAGHA